MRALALCTLLLATPANAESYSVSLGGKTLGQLTYSESARVAELVSTLNNTPLGVFNGTFTGISSGNALDSRFRGESKSSRKQRLVTVTIEQGRALEVGISPHDERTELSDTARVPADVMDPVRAMGQLFRAQGCPAPVRMYDGRRVITMQSNSGRLTGNELICTVSYNVVAGPGHLSPLGISSARMELAYHTANGQQTLEQMRISSGIFSVTLDRQN